MSERLRKYRKKIIAVLVIILMIVFVVELGLSRGGGDPSADEVVARFGDGQEITNAEQRQFAAEWNLLTRGEMAQYTPRFLGDALLSNLPVQGQDFMAQFMAMQAMRSVEALTGSIDERTYMLLVKEADRLGIQLNRDRLEEMRNILSRLPSQAPETRDRAVINWMNVVEVFNRMSRAVKVSPAQALHAVARQQQQVALEVVPFSAADYKEQVPEPTPEQLQAFFEKYRDVSAEASEFGIGYRFPDRVKVEYIKVPKDAIAKTITDEDIYKYWKDNQAQFQRLPDTQPAATLPEGPIGPSAATMPATAPAAPVASTQPTTRPWTEVKDEIRDILANQRAAAMAASINQTLRADWPNFREAMRAPGASATQPSRAQTSLGVPYNTYPYLQALQKRIQAQKESRGVLPELVWDDNFLTPRELEQLPGIGQARLRTPDGRAIPFPQFAIGSAEAFMTEAERRQAQENRFQTQALYQPSPPFYEEATGNYYIFRLTDAQPAHPAESLAVVESRVREDWKSMQAYELAQQAARKFLEEAKAQGLQQAAGDRKVITTGLFRNDPNAETLPSYALSPPATRKLIEGGFDLLADRVRTGDEHPLGVIDLPRAFTSTVARLAEATPATRDQYFAVQVQQTRQMQEFERITQMMFKWFHPEAVADRLDFEPVEWSEPAPAGAAPPPMPVIPGR